MNTSSQQSSQEATVENPSGLSEAGAPASGGDSNDSQNQPGSTGTAPVQTPADPFANSNWPDSAKEKVRKLSGQKRELSEKLQGQADYIAHLEAEQKKVTMPKREGFNSDEDFVTAVTGAQAKMASLETEKGRVQGEATRTQREAGTLEQHAMTEKVALARQAFPDWDNTVQNSKTPVGPHLAYAMNLAHNGAHIAYIIAKNPTEATRLNSMPWQDILQEFPVVESRFALTQPGKKPQVAPKPPIEPVGGSDMGKLSPGYKEFEAKRNKERGPF